MEEHKRRVSGISTAVASFYERKLPFRIYHGSSNSTRIPNFSRASIVDTSALSRVLSVDVAAHTVLVEPNVTMSTLVAATLHHGLVPPCVPEFPAITVGGAFAGTAGESSSFKHGFFDRCVRWCEIVLADGEVVRASPTERVDLFYGSCGSMGTLGVVTLFELALEDAPGCVEVTYRAVDSREAAVKAIEEEVDSEKWDFIDAIVYAKDRGVIVLGKHCRKDDSRQVQRFTRARDQWFYLHAEKRLAEVRKLPQSPVDEKQKQQAKRGPVDIVPIEDYLFRYDRGAFWTGKYSFSMFFTPYNRLTRFLLDPLMKTQRMYRALHHSGQMQRYVIQDLSVPAPRAVDFMEYVDSDFGIFPLWLCPLRADNKAMFQPVGDDGRLLINVGVWGPGHGYSKGQDWFRRFVDDNRRMEEKVTECGGVKWLYAQTYYTEEEFWRLYPRGQYEALRQKYNAEGLPDLYEKVKANDAPVPTSRFRAVAMMLVGMDPMFRNRVK